MSLADAGGASPTSAFVCNKSESVLSVIEKCLDNGLGTCLIVEDDERLVGRISLDDIRQALLDGTRDRRPDPRMALDRRRRHGVDAPAAQRYR